MASLESVRLVAAINPAGVSASRPPIKTESGDLTEDLRSIPSRLVRGNPARYSLMTDRMLVPMIKTDIPAED